MLLTAPGGLADQVPKDLAKLAGLVGALFGRKSPSGGAIGVIEVERLTVRFAGVTPIDDMTVDVPRRDLRPDRPERRRQDDVLQRPLAGSSSRSRGSVKAFGEDLLAMADYRRARWGLRRTFQTEQAIEQLSVFDNVAMVHEHSGASRASRRSDVLSAIEFVGLEVSPKAKVAGLGARERRLVEVARAVVGEPRVVLLDEPAAGLPDEETAHLGRVIQRIPGRSSARS